MNRARLFLALATLCVAMTSRAEPPDTGPTVLTLRPSGEPVPALKYRLVPERNTLVPGNAAPFYHRAMHFVMQSRPQPGKPGESPDERASKWIQGPISEIPRDEAKTLLDSFKNALSEVELGAIRTTCDWEFDQRKEGIYLMLPEIQEMRSLARFVSLRAKLATLEGKTDEAMHWIQVGFVMGRHVSEGPTIIQYLVGVAIDSIMCVCLEELIQSPGTPSLYWALADRPRPLIDMSRALTGERYLLERELPGLTELNRGPWSLDQARKFADEMQRKLFTIVQGEPIPGTNTAIPDMPSMLRRLGVAAMAAKIYPEARRALIAGGRPVSEVDAMPVIQASSIHVVQEYQKLRDDTYKWMNVPYWQSFNRIHGEALTVEDKLANPLLTMFRLMTPALNSVRLAQLRLERRLDALQCVEAIRLYAAGHDGKFPPSLDALTDSPAPIDTATGKPFVYTVDGDSANLNAPIPSGAPDHPSYGIRYVLKWAK